MPEIQPLRLITSRAWPAMLARIIVLGVAAFVAVSWGVDRVWSNPSLEREFPKTDFSRHVVDMSEIISGGPPRDGIPAIDRPRFIAPGQAEWLHPDEPVIVVRVGDDARAYPIQILIWHEIVNDVVGGKPLAVTFCPLCNATLVFEREFDGTLMDFGTTGRLRMSDLVMYDRQTETWWQQFTGEGLVGRYAGETLTESPASIVSFADFQRAHPDGKVLSRETGYNRRYGQNPYRGYDRIGQSPFLFDGELDDRLPPMERVLAVSADGQSQRAYPFGKFREQRVVNDQVGDLPVVVMSRSDTFSALDDSRITASRRVPSVVAFDRRLDGRELEFELRDGQIVDRQTESVWNLLGRAESGPLGGRSLDAVEGGVHFAFAWLAFRPDTEIFDSGVSE